MRDGLRPLCLISRSMIYVVNHISITNSQDELRLFVREANLCSLSRMFDLLFMPDSFLEEINLSTPCGVSSPCRAKRERVEHRLVDGRGHQAPMMRY